MSHKQHQLKCKRPLSSHTQILYKSTTFQVCYRHPSLTSPPLSYHSHNIWIIMRWGQIGTNCLHLHSHPPGHPKNFTLVFFLGLTCLIRDDLARWDERHMVDGAITISYVGFYCYNTASQRESWIHCLRKWCVPLVTPTHNFSDTSLAVCNCQFEAWRLSTWVCLGLPTSYTLQAGIWPTLKNVAVRT